MARPRSMVLTSTRTSSLRNEENPTMYSSQFTDKSSSMKASRSLYMKIVAGGTLAMTVVMFCVFSIYWGAVWKIPAHNLQGWVVDFDGSTVGNAIVKGLVSSSSKVTWTERSSSEFSGPEEVANLIVDQKAWVAVVVNSNATMALQYALSSVNSSYDGSEAITVYAVEARNENAYRSLVRPSVQTTLAIISQVFAQSFLRQVASSSSSTLASISTTAPQILTEPISYTINNLRPFDVPVASAITFVGLIYVLVLSFFIVNFCAAARELSGLEKSLTTGSLIRVRMVSSFLAYFALSLFYSLLSRAFQVNFSRVLGPAGFLVFWMANFAGMLAVGLALEAMMTLMTLRFVAFFMILWIIVNVSVCFMPIDVLPHIFRYGYAFPFYNLSGAVRTIVFGTKNQLGMQFGILIAWTVISMITIPLIQWLMRRKAVARWRAQQAGVKA
ncbi:uncharacterized protein EV420DRAFT_1766667 [Desarmillaria tabescens]|uniref:DUF3533 domain-containing protein n=1 Tax=Armillaria tabescens TaxID=1929756 RepID=A0AA39JX74_ARMTA|nr:uncharacterized protein EV420DRAFT_1766667 [Desarmillaria tabescens]KAK0450591.1 hypothetical protein EV420DRAFT_1766667 [Desarmillaria tabescens]